MLNRRELLRSAGLLAAATMIPSSLQRLALAQQAANGRKPNVLFIAVDDLKPELPCYGANHIVAPNIEKLAASGTVFQRAYCQQAVCAPSRASLLTGCRPDTTGVHGLRTPLPQSRPDLTTIPKHFHDNGYRTVGLGKIFHHGPSESPGAFDSFKSPEGESKGRGYLLDENLLPATNPARPSNHPGAATERLPVPDNAYRDGAISDEALQLLPELKNEPFFMALGYWKPHLPFAAPDKYWDLYDPRKIDLPEWRTKPRYGLDIAMHDSGELLNYGDIPKDGKMTDEQMINLIHGYYACISYVDAQVGKVLDELDRQGLADNTIVCLWGDHGWHLGDHGLWCKHTNFEQATLSPLIVRAPGIAGGNSSKALVEFVDVFPALCELTGIETPAQVEGDSFVPLMRQPDRAWKSAAFHQWPHHQGKLGRSVRTDRYRLTRWADRDATGATGEIELYDYVTDPEETTNLAPDAENAQLVQKLIAQLDAGWKSARAAG